MDAKGTIVPAATPEIADNLRKSRRERPELGVGVFMGMGTLI
jgi:hypothetical protein